MRNSIRWLLVVLAVVAAVVVLRLTVLRPKPIPVAVAEVAKGPVEETVTNTRAGTVKARLRAKLSPQIGGVVIAIPHREGSPVAAGTVVLRLDDAVQRSQLALAHRQVEAASANAQEACLAAELAVKELRRVTALSHQGIATDQQLDTATSERDRSQAGCEAGRAAVKEARARVDAAQVQLDLTVLRAPFSGVVAEVSTEEGEWITPAPPGVPIPPVLDLIDPTSVYVSAPIDEVDSERVSVGQEVRITVDSRRGESFPGTVARVAPYVLDVLEQNRTVEVEVDFADPGVAAGMLPGTSADVEIILKRRDGVLRVPTAAVAEGDHVLVLADGRLHDRVVRLGLRNWQYAEVLEGLAAGDLVVTARDSTAVKDGARAVVRPPEA